MYLEILVITNTDV
jgi:cryptochrome